MSRSADIVSRYNADLVGFECVASAATTRLVECKDGRSFTVETRRLDSKQVDIDGELWSLDYDSFTKSICLKRWSETPAQAKANAKIKASAKSDEADTASGDLPV